MRFDPGKRSSAILYDYVLECYGDPVEKTVEALDRIKGGKVLIATGFPVKPNVLENDGPIGSIVLSEALKRRGFSPVIGIYRGWIEPLIRVAEAVNLKIDVTELQLLDNAKDRDRVSAVFFVELPCSNIKGVRHNMRGEDISAQTINVESLLSYPFTVGIGDGGNEVGMGKIEEIVRRSVKYGEVCQCDCKGGIAACGPTTILIPSGTSNWGCYALAAALGYVHSEENEMKMLKAAAENGFVDGVTKKPSLSVDELSIETEAEFLRALRKIFR